MTVATPQDPVAQAALIALRGSVINASRRGQKLRIVGGGTKDFYGQALQGDPLDVSGYRGIVSYEPTELVVTARCGTPLADLQALLADHSQMLAFEPPAFGANATVGGMVAAGLSGPRRATAGAVKDFVLGASLLTAGGDLLYFGGQVMKNVAGYDVSRLLCGSLGTLGILADVSLKVLPVPAAEVTMRWPVPAEHVITLLNEWGGKPLPLSATCWTGGRLVLRFSGARAAVDTAVKQFAAVHGAQTLAPAEATRYWAGIREHTDPFFSGEGALWRLSVVSTAPMVSLPGVQLIEWGGALRWFRTQASASDVRAAAVAAGGTATLFRGGDRTGDVFHPIAPASLRIQQRIKHEYDPRGIFNVGRLVREF